MVHLSKVILDAVGKIKLILEIYIFISRPLMLVDTFLNYVNNMI